MGQRHWKGPWLRTKQALEYVGYGHDDFSRLLRACPALTQARRRRGDGVQRKHYVYPVQALDFAMNEAAPR